MNKTKADLRIVYMGTPDFAVESLRRLVEGGYNVVGVVTMPDKPVGRHQTELAASAVKQYALAQGIPVLQPERLKDDAFVEALRTLRADLQIVVAFRMLPEVVWAMPPLGTFNLHASLLPQYRGAAPINWAVINGDAETGVTTFFLQHAIDTGNIIMQRRISIAPADDAGTVHDALMALGAQTVIDTVEAILAGQANAQPQDESIKLLPAPKIFKETCRIPWAAGARCCHDFVRGLSPYPAAWTQLVVGQRRQVLKIYKAHLADSNLQRSAYDLYKPYEPTTTFPLLQSDNTLAVRLADGLFVIDELQLAGKRRMPTADFLRGFRPEDGMYVE